MLPSLELIANLAPVNSGGAVVQRIGLSPFHFGCREAVTRKRIDLDQRACELRQKGSHTGDREMARRDRRNGAAARASARANPS
jgi:hypothetical protein